MIVDRSDIHAAWEELKKIVGPGAVASLTMELRFNFLAGREEKMIFRAYTDRHASDNHGWGAEKDHPLDAVFDIKRLLPPKRKDIWGDF